jgi:hypothetical protein
MFIILLPLNNEARVALAEEVLATCMTSTRAHRAAAASGKRGMTQALTAVTAECMAGVHQSLVRDKRI